MTTESMIGQATILDATEQDKYDAEVIATYSWNTCVIAYNYLHDGVTKDRHDRMKHFLYRNIVDMANAYNRATI